MRYFKSAGLTPLAWPPPLNAVVLDAAQDRVVFLAFGEDAAGTLLAVVAVVTDPRFAQHLPAEAAVPAFFLAVRGVAAVRLARPHLEGVRRRAQTDDRLAGLDVI